MKVETAACDLIGLLRASIYDEEVIGIRTTLFVYMTAVVTCFLLNVLTENYSHVDRLWSIMPSIYAWILVNDHRAFLMACLSTVWGARLTWNFGRRGGYNLSGQFEDYRWSYLRKGFLFPWLKNPAFWQIFNIGFICIYQHFLLWLIVSPSVIAHLVAKECQASSLNGLDLLVSTLFLIGIAIEYVADNQQFEFQREKQLNQTRGHTLTGEYADGFKQSGLFAIVRKPNYSAEQFVWISYYLFSISATDEQKILNWSVLGSINLLVLFQGSGWFTECITLSKYPKYVEYQKKVPLYLPSLPLFTRKSKHA